MADMPKADQESTKTTKPKAEAVVGDNQTKAQQDYNEKHTEEVKANNGTDKDNSPSQSGNNPNTNNGSATTTAALSSTGKSEAIDPTVGVNTATGTAPHPDLARDSSTSAADTGAVKAGY